MPAVKPFRNPWEAAQAVVQDHVQVTYGIRDADPLRVVADMVFGKSEYIPGNGETDGYWTGPTPELRLNAAKTLLKYTRPEVRAVHMHIEGQVDVEHSHKGAEALTKAKSLLSLLGAQKYKSGEPVEAEATEVLEHLQPDSVQH